MVLLFNFIASLQTIEIQEVKMSTSPMPFANNKCYGSKSSMYEPRNKIRGATE